MEFRPASIGYDFRHKFKAAFRLTATMNSGGVPIHFEIIMVNSAFDRKVSISHQSQLVLAKSYYTAKK